MTFDDAVLTQAHRLAYVVTSDEEAACGAVARSIARVQELPAGDDDFDELLWFALREAYTFRDCGPLAAGADLQSFWSLPAEDRLLWWMAMAELADPPEIGALLGWSPDRCASRLSRLRDQAPAAADRTDPGQLLAAVPNPDTADLRERAERCRQVSLLPVEALAATIGTGAAAASSRAGTSDELPRPGRRAPVAGLRLEPSWDDPEWADFLRDDNASEARPRPAQHRLRPGRSRRGAIAVLAVVGAAVVAAGFVRPWGGSTKAHRPTAAAAPIASSPAAAFAEAQRTGTATQQRMVVAAASPAQAGGQPAGGRPAATPPPTRPAPAVTPPTAAAPVTPVTYTVKPGDTLSGIAEWFDLHGYGAIYAANMAVIGSDPNLILPGEQIRLSSAGMTITSP